MELFFLIKNFTLVKNTIFISKKIKFGLFYEFRNIFWFEYFVNFFETVNYKKKNFFFKNSFLLKIILFFQKIGGKIQVINFKKNKEKKFILNNYKIFKIILIDEYINGRKKALIFSKKKYFQWNKITWKNFENEIENILFNLFYDEKIEEFFLILIETLRFDIIRRIAKNNKNFQKLINFFFQIKNISFTTKFNDFFNNLLNLLVFNWKNFNSHHIDHENLYYVHFLQNVFEKNKKRKKKRLNKIYYLVEIFCSNKIRIFFDNLYENGIFSFKLYWINYGIRNLFNLFRIINYRKIKENFRNFANNNLEKDFSQINLSKIFFFEFFNKLENPNIFLKIPFIFAIGFFCRETNNLSFFSDILSKLEKIYSWEKFQTGISFFFINFKNFEFYKSIFILLENKKISPFLKGGVCIGIGLEYKKFLNFEKKITDYFLRILQENNEIGFHYGVCLAIGLFFIKKIKDPLKSRLCKQMLNLISSELIIGLSSSLSIGLVFLGLPCKNLLKELLYLIYETENEKTLNGLMFGISLLFFETKGESETFFYKFIEEKDPNFRRCAILIYSLAYSKTGNFRILNIFLKILTSDPDNNVKKSAIIGIGFLFYSKFNMVEKIFEKLAQHYNPFIRYGISFAIGISCKEKFHFNALKILERLFLDPIDFVRQSAYISMGIILNGRNNFEKKKKIINYFKKQLNNQNETAFSKFGLLIGLSFMLSKTKSNDKKTMIRIKDIRELIGLFLFSHHNSWIHFLSFFFLE